MPQKIMRFPRRPIENHAVTEKVLSKVLIGINKYNKKQKREASVVTLRGSVFAKPKVYVSSGIMSLDCTVGYGLGFPPGIIEVYGPEGSGKTAVMENVLAEAQRKGSYTGLFPMEFSPDYRRMRSVGIDDDLLHVFEDAETIEDVYDLTKDWVTRIRKEDKHTPIVLGWDSIASTPSRTELAHKKGLEGSDMGKVPLLMSRFFRRMVKFLFTNEVCLICTNQTRSNIGTYGAPETTAGGKALRFYAWVRCRISAGQLIKNKDDEEIGQNSELKVRKNKFAPPFRKCILPIYWERGIDVYGANWHYCVDNGIISRDGSVYKFKGVPISKKTFPRVYLENKEKFDKRMKRIKQGAR